MSNRYGSDIVNRDELRPWAKLMKRKEPKQDPVVDGEILEQAKASVAIDKFEDGKSRQVRCSVCGAEANPSGEQLCWVCRRLKISAWRDIEQQMPMQE